MVRNRAMVGAFYTAGYGQQVLNHPWVYLKRVISNYTNHIANTPVDAAFQNFACRKK
jgi:hypothetical protein